MILDFKKYKMLHQSPDSVIIYPGLQLHVRRYESDVKIMGLPEQDIINIELTTSTEAIRLMHDIDMFLQYKTRDLPEYLL
jgi:hypothetical protein